MKRILHLQFFLFQLEKSNRQKYTHNTKLNSKKVLKQNIDTEQIKITLAV